MAGARTLRGLVGGSDVAADGAMEPDSVASPLSGGIVVVDP